MDIETIELEDKVEVGEVVDRELNELEILEHIIHIVNQRYLPSVLFNYNPEIFMKWQGNICKQAAIIDAMIIKEKLPEGYTHVEVWEGFFEHEKMGSYNHCWNYIVHESDPELNIICDYTSSIPYFNYCKDNDPTLHISKGVKSVNNSRIDYIGCEEINFEDLLEQEELFTKLTTKELYSGIKNLLIQSRLW